MTVLHRGEVVEASPSLYDLRGEVWRSAEKVLRGWVEGVLGDGVGKGGKVASREGLS